MSESINKELVDALQAFLDVAPSEGYRCIYCDARVYGTNDTDDHSPDCEMARGYAAVASANKANEKTLMGNQRAAELCAIIEQIQRAANRAGREMELAGDEPHPLNIIDNALFGTLMIAKTAIGTLGKGGADNDGPEITP